MGLGGSVLRAFRTASYFAHQELNAPPTGFLNSYTVEGLEIRASKRGFIEHFVQSGAKLFNCEH